MRSSLLKTAGVLVGGILIAPQSVRAQESPLPFVSLSVSNQQQRTRAAIRHVGIHAGWRVSETENFRIHHRGIKSPQNIADSIEHTRAAVYATWLKIRPGRWEPKCDLYIHASLQDCQREVGMEGSSTGQFRFRRENGRIIQRKIDVRSDYPAMHSNVIPHEVTHAVLVEWNGLDDVPRWMDEGIAALSEEPNASRKHLMRGNGAVLPLRDVLSRRNYPRQHLVSSFYAQSVSLTRYLVELRGPDALMDFLRIAERSGYDSAAQRIYGFKDVDDLERHWNEHSREASKKRFTQRDRVE